MGKIDEVSNKNYYLRLDDSNRLTLELTEDKSMEECVRLTMACINEMASQVPAYNSKPSRAYFQPNSDPAKAHRNGYRLGVRDTIAKIKNALGNQRRV